MSVTRTPARATPGRRKNLNKENVYFEPGKRGRKTGITLKDTGVRDEHGFEPVSGIFSSPAKPSPEHDTGNALASSEMELQESSAPEPTEVLLLRKTPHLPPKSRTPRHTNIGGSPVRHSSVKPISRATPSQETPSRMSPLRTDRSPNRLLVFSNSDVMATVEKSPSPFKTRPALGTKNGKQRKSIFEFNLSPEKKRRNSGQSDVSQTTGAIEEIVESLAMENDAELPTLNGVEPHVEIADGNDYMAPMDDHYEDNTVPEIIEAVVDTREKIDEPNVKRKRGRPRSSIIVVDPVLLAQDSPATHSSSKRRKTTPDESILAEELLADSTVNLETQVESPSRLTKSPSPRRKRRISVHKDTASDESGSEFNAPVEQTVEPEEHEDTTQKPVAQARKRGRKSVAAKARKPAKQPTQRDPNTAARSTQKPKRSQSPTNATETVTETGPQQRGPRSAIRLQSVTPFEDDGMKVTRSGRASVKPLQYWKNESFIWRHGEIDGIVRAEEVAQPKRQIPKRRRTGPLDSIVEEEDEPEDLLPEAWEEELGVIKGPVRSWDPELGAGSLEDEVEEEVAFSSSAIPTRDVQGSRFRYAKVMTMDFFGNGILEIPPTGYKRAKNSRKMQMVFFVHEGKVTVEVAGMTFGLTKGGVWQVPRGNNYAITNESETFPAKIFFAQGCEADIGAEGNGAQT